MGERVSAHLRRQRTLLEWIDADKGEAVVVWRSTELGTWKDLHPEWMAAGGPLRLRFRCGGRSQTFRVSTVRLTPEGAEILLSGSRRRLPEPLRVKWQDVAAGESAEVHDLWLSVLRWAQAAFPGYRIRSVARRPDRALSFTGSYLRVLFTHRGKSRLLLAAHPGSPAEAYHPILTQALLWSTQLRKDNRLRGVAKVRILVPSGRSEVIQHRSLFLNPARVTAEIFEYEAEGFGAPLTARRSSPPPAPVENRDFRWPVLGPFRWSPLLARVLDLAPHHIRRYPRFQDYDSLRLCGLEFARVLGPERDRVLFGVGPDRTELGEDNFENLRALVEEILHYRRPDTPAAHHPYYRMQAERWLESLILEDVSRLFPELAPESVYPQIPVYLGKDPGRVDILGADRQGALVVMELKVAEDAEMPLQALDYWGRVIQHNAGGDFERRGYFSCVRLRRGLPRIYLVCPVFSFHDSTESLLRHIDPRVEIWKIAVNEDWRSGVKILRRTRCTCVESG